MDDDSSAQDVDSDPGAGSSDDEDAEFTELCSNVGGLVLNVEFIKRGVAALCAKAGVDIAGLLAGAGAAPKATGAT